VPERAIVFHATLKLSLTTRWHVTGAPFVTNRERSARGMVTRNSAFENPATRQNLDVQFEDLGGRSMRLGVIGAA
jgi:hypothetical protein